MNQWLPVAHVDDVAAGGVKAVAANGTRLALCHAADGAWYAVDDRCTHDNGPLAEGTLEHGQLECPRHGARFDVRTGQVQCLPAVIPIKSYPVKVEGHEVLVNIG